MAVFLLYLLASSIALVVGHQTHLHDELGGDSEEWLNKYGAQIDQTFSGPLSFSHLNYTRCLEDTATKFDIAVLGMPFDTATTYRPGARFGPFAIRSGSRRQRPNRAWTLGWQMNPYEAGYDVIDCGDVGVYPFSIDRLRVNCVMLGTRFAFRQCFGHGSD